MEFARISEIAYFLNVELPSLCNNINNMLKNEGYFPSVIINVFGQQRSGKTTFIYLEIVSRLIKFLSNDSNVLNKFIEIKYELENNIIMDIFGKLIYNPSIQSEIKLYTNPHIFDLRKQIKSIIYKLIKPKSTNSRIQIIRISALDLFIHLVENLNVNKSDEKENKINHFYAALLLLITIIKQIIEELPLSFWERFPWNSIRRKINRLLNNIIINFSRIGYTSVSRITKSTKNLATLISFILQPLFNFSLEKSIKEKESFAVDPLLFSNDAMLNLIKVFDILSNYLTKHKKILILIIEDVERCLCDIITSQTDTDALFSLFYFLLILKLLIKDYSKNIIAIFELPEEYAQYFHPSFSNIFTKIENTFLFESINVDISYYPFYKLYTYLYITQLAYYSLIDKEKLFDPDDISSYKPIQEVIKLLKNEIKLSLDCINNKNQTNELILPEKLTVRQTIYPVYYNNNEIMWELSFLSDQVLKNILKITSSVHQKYVTVLDSIIALDIYANSIFSVFDLFRDEKYLKRLKDFKKSKSIKYWTFLATTFSVLSIIINYVNLNTKSYEDFILLLLLYETYYFPNLFLMFLITKFLDYYYPIRFNILFDQIEEIKKFIIQNFNEDVKIIKIGGAVYFSSDWYEYGDDVPQRTDVCFIIHFMKDYFSTSYIYPVLFVTLLENLFINLIKNKILDKFLYILIDNSIVEILLNVEYLPPIFKNNLNSLKEKGKIPLVLVILILMLTGVISSLYKFYTIKDKFDHSMIFIFPVVKNEYIDEYNYSTISLFEVKQLYKKLIEIDTIDKLNKFIEENKYKKDVLHKTILEILKKLRDLFQKYNSQSNQLTTS